ncbi:FAD binding domain-containing protein [Pyrenochaeta sp. MPI-SDFR-AT-0127]|nr:FAD binding domain-containing protein [Pyrenochaeta sp. MPI-SDFR-AT-0127]
MSDRLDLAGYGSENTGSAPCPPRTIATDVFVVGAGVTGLTISILLAELGVQAFTIAKHSGVSPTPRAHITNQRTMEIFRDMGIEDQIIAAATPLKNLGNGVMATSLTGMEIGRYSCYGAGPDQLTDFTKASPTEMMNIPQHILEKILLNHAILKKAEVRYHNELLSIEQTTEGIVGKVRDRSSGEEYLVQARYAVAADGGRSLVAQQMGFKFQGEAKLINMLSTWLEVDLTKYTAYRPASIYMILQPGNSYWVGSGTCIVVKPFNEWILNRQYDSLDGEPDTTPKALIDHARRILGLPDDLPILVKDASKWQVNNVVATSYQNGRIFLAGDAAHRHPPASGLGSNTCIQDSYNLAWKLALAVRGLAGEGLLKSYDEERQPVGKQVVDHAIITLNNMTKIPEALGFKRGQSFDDGFTSLKQLFANSPESEKRRAGFEEIIRLQNKRSNALGIQLGKRYEDSSCILTDETPFPKLQRDPILCYEPTTHPGSYLPHAFVEYERHQISTLDIIPHGKFGLLVGIGGSPWIAAAARISRELGIDLSAYAVGYRCKYDDVLGQWSAVREIRDTGVLLVRPDRYIAWRSLDDCCDVVTVLRSVFLQILDRKPTNGILSLV